MGVDLVVSFVFFKDVHLTIQRRKLFVRGVTLGCKVEGHRRTTWCCWETDWFDRKVKEMTVDSLK